MSLATGLSSLATRIGNEIRDAIKPRLIPSGGTTGQAMTKSSGTNYAVTWTTLFSGAYADLTGKPTLGTAAAKNVHVGTSAPGSPAEGDIWIDTN